jgi:hypothetical protein
MNIFDAIFKEEYKESIRRERKKEMTSGSVAGHVPEKVIKNVTLGLPQETNKSPRRRITK